MKRILLPVTLFLLFFACRNKQPGTSTAPVSDTSVRKPDTTRKNYLPVGDYLKYEIASVDSFPQRIMKYQVEKGKTDSGIITTAAFDQIAKQFLLPELDSSYFENHFTENSFVDRSTNLVSFTYSTKDTADGLKRVDILLSPSASGIDKLSSIYMEKLSAGPDSTLISKLSWKAGRNFRILQIRRAKTGLEKTSQTIVVWDSRD